MKTNLQKVIEMFQPLSFENDNTQTQLEKLDKAISTREHTCVKLDYELEKLNDELDILEGLRSEIQGEEEEGEHEETPEEDHANTEMNAIYQNNQ